MHKGIVLTLFQSLDKHWLFTVSLPEWREQS
jgi:hypothetical protein